MRFSRAQGTGLGAFLAGALAVLSPGEARAQLPGELPGQGGAPWTAALVWERCPPPDPASLECATLSVPLDHARPSGDRLPLRVWRLRASGPRLGSLVLIDGAPGSPDALSLPAMARALSPALRARLDLVSWQRRGSGGRGQSAALHCWASDGEAKAWRNRLPPSLPVAPGEQRRWLESWAELARACERRQPQLLPHLSSADSARDLELLRQALGEKTLRLRASGVATTIGATYANLFPRSLGALVLDGAVDPMAWADNGNPVATEGADVRLERDLGLGATLLAFVRRCAAVGRPRCAFAPGGTGGTDAAGDRRYAELLARLRQGPVRWGERRVGMGEMFGELRRRLATVSPDGQGQGGWEGAGRFLEGLSRGGGSDAPEEGPPEVEAPEQALAQRCGESPHPRDGAAIQLLAEQVRGRSGPLGPWAVWGDGRCAAWPAAARAYSGPWGIPTPVPVLVIGHRFDPVLPFQSSLAMARELGRGLLLSVNGYGHTVLRNPNRCVAALETTYYLAGTVPPLGTVCSPDAAPFAGPP